MTRRLRRLGCFLALVWRDYYGRISLRTAWEVSGIFHGRQP